jgi:hypothetical protein
MIEAEAVYSLVFHQPENRRNLLIVKASYGKPQRHPQSQSDTVSDTIKGCLIGAVSTAESVVAGPDTIKTYAHLAKPMRWIS